MNIDDDIFDNLIVMEDNKPLIMRKHESRKEVFREKFIDIFLVYFIYRIRI